jgi:tRNA threonylcarbamoyladenosine biosynthesis protein TsaE
LEDARHFFWPPTVSREITLESFISAFQSLGYSVCEDDALEPGFEKVALFADEHRIPTHAARQLESGQWTSKLGQSEDIEHDLRALEGAIYGSVTLSMKRSLAMNNSTSLLVESLAETEALGRRLGELLFPNAVVALIGPLGAGKTHFVRAVAEGLGIRNPLAVTSPTFVLIQEYPARLPIFHFDAYRLRGPSEFLDLGVHEYFEGGGVCLIEWADRVIEALPEERLRIEIEPLDENRRRFRVTAIGLSYERLLPGLLLTLPKRP